MTAVIIITLIIAVYAFCEGAYRIYKMKFGKKNLNVSTRASRLQLFRLVYQPSISPSVFLPRLESRNEN